MSETTIALTLFARAALNLNQRTLGAMLGLSRRTIQRWDSKRSAPTADHLKQIAIAVHPHDPVLAAKLAERGGATLAELGLVPPAAPAPAPLVPVEPPAPRLSPEMVRHLVDAVVCAAADSLGTPPASARPVLRTALRKVLEVGLSIEDVVAVLDPPPVPRAAGAGNRKKPSA